jgi:hypothetical protein
MVNSYQDWVELYKSSFSGNLIWRISTIIRWLIF